ncbi:Hsp33 family molecular chaperone HslO [Algiphilus sp.]|uniref:Hsp33 family molecular chaperone HslO n=1 Tax=Algiphilus sp. TaxID=1872431 RepID=UPI003C3E798C
MPISPEQAPDEHVTPFMLPEHGVRGAILRVSAGVASMLDSQGQPPDVRRLLGQLCAAAPLMAAHLKFEGRMSLQIQSSDQLALMVVQTEDTLRTRGMARTRGEASGDFAELTRGGVFAVTIEPRSGRSYQALVPLEAHRAAEALEGYFAQSEQLPTRFVLACEGDTIAGLLLQRLPETQADAGWEHVGALIDTVEDTEILAQSPATMLHRLFHAEALQLYGPLPMEVACSCSQARISRMLLSLGEKEVRDIVAEQGSVTVHCDFCGAGYHYDAAQVQALFAAENASADDQPPPPAGLH